MQLKDFKGKGYKHPYIAWLFDKKPLYAVAMTASLGAVAVLGTQTTTAVEDIKTPPKVDTPYNLSVAATPTPSLKWAQAVAELTPSTTKQWNTSKASTPTQPVAFKECSSFGIVSPNATATVKGSNPTITTTVQTYLPGTTAKAFQDYKATYGKCWAVKSETMGEPATEMVSYEDGFFFSYGDAILFVTAPKDQQEELKQFYLTAVKDTLVKSECANLTTKQGDLTRNIYLNPKGYRGLIRTDTIHTQVELRGLPQGRLQTLRPVERREAPEGPLAATMPKELPGEMSKPQEPANPDTNHKPFQQNISYQIDDVKGPGCGWAWAGLKKPILDNDALASQATALRSSAQATVDGNAQEYVNHRLDYSKKLMSTMVAFNQWNSYVRQVESVSARWQWLEERRDALRPEWGAYVEAHDDWMNFDNRKANALKAYNAEVESCNAKARAYEQWQQQYGALAGQPGVVYENASYQDKALDSVGTYTVVPVGFKQAPPTPNPVPPQPVPVTPAPAPPMSTPPAPPVAPQPNTPQSPAPTVPPVEPTTPSYTPEQPLPVDPTPSPTPTPSITIPPPPSTCESYPERPSILDEQKGPEPQEPKREPEVTIPYSWPRPVKTPTVSLD